MSSEAKEETHEREILSPNFNEEDVKEWTNCTMLIPHEPIRCGLKVLVQITNPKYYQATDVEKLKKKITLLFTYYNETFYFFVHHHHDVEENIYFPWIVKNTEKLPDKISKEHDELIAMLNEIKDSFNTFTEIFNNQEFNQQDFKNNLNKLHEICKQLQQDMIQHLNEEEKIVPALLRKYNIKQQDEGAVVNKIVQSLGLSGNKIMLPWIIDIMYNWGGQHAVEQFKSNIPAPIRFIQWMFWDSHYIKNNKAIIQKIQDDDN